MRFLLLTWPFCDEYSADCGNDMVVSGFTVVDDSATEVSDGNTAVSKDGRLGITEDRVETVVDWGTVLFADDTFVSRGQRGSGVGIGKAAHESARSHGDSAGKFGGTGKHGEAWSMAIGTWESSETKSTNGIILRVRAGKR